MIRHFSSWAIAVAAAAMLLQPAAPVPAAVVTQDQSPAAAGPIAIRFDPPLDRPLVYRRSKQVVGSRGARSMWSRTEYRFSRRDGGFRLRVRPLEAGIEGGHPSLQDAYRRVAASLDRPFFLMLDDQGAIVGMEDEEAYWAEMQALAERVARETSPSGTPADQAMIAQLNAMFRDTPREARLATISEATAPIVEFGSAELTPGSEVSTEMQWTGLFGLSGNQRIRILPERVEDGKLILTLHGSVPRDELARSLEQFMTRITAAGAADAAGGADQMIALLRNAALSHETEAHYEVALDSGLTVRHRSVEQVDISYGGDTSRQVTTIVLERED